MRENQENQDIEVIHQIISTIFYLSTPYNSSMDGIASYNRIERLWVEKEYVSLFNSNDIITMKHSPA